MSLIEILSVVGGLAGFAALIGASYFAEDCRIQELDAGLGGAL